MPQGARTLDWQARTVDSQACCSRVCALPWAGAAARLGGRYLVITPIGQARLRALVDGLAALKGAGMEAREAELMAEAEALTLTLSLTLSLALTPSP